MKAQFPQVTIVAVIALFAWLSAGSILTAQSVPVSLDVEVAKTSKEKHAAVPGPGSEDRLLEITLKNPSGQALTNLEVKYWLMIRDVKTRDIAVGVNDSSTLTLPAYGEEVVTSTVAKCDYTPRTAAAKAKGNKFYGYGVQVVEEGKIVSQTYDPTDVKTEIAGGAPK